MAEFSTASSCTFKPLSDEGEAALPAVASNSEAKKNVESAADIIAAGYDEDDDEDTDKVRVISVELPAGGVAALPNPPGRKQRW